MIDQDHVNRIASRYHMGELDDFNAAQAVFDVGYLLGCISHQREMLSHLEQQVIDLRGIVAALQRERPDPGEWGVSGRVRTHRPVEPPGEG